MSERLWVFRQVNPELQANLAQALAISPVTASVLLSRGIQHAEEARRWLSPSDDGFYDPFLLPDMERAVDRLHHACVRRERVCFYGDYDVDGISATSLYLSFFQQVGLPACAYIPHRVREGYGLNEQAILNLHREQVSLIVTSDCGSTSYREIELARQLGVDVMVTDHHQLDTRMPPALALLNPHRLDARYPFTGLCSAGLAFKVVQAYVIRHGRENVDLTGFYDLVALATVADVVPLREENRRFVREGLHQISRGARCGLRALKQVAGITRPCSADTIAFRLGPRLNAAGRLDHALLGVRLLTTESDREALQVAEQLEALNRRRQAMEEEIQREALAIVEAGRDTGAIVVASRRWHVGVVGIVAARLVERYHKPAVVIAIDQHGIGKGSARTLDGFDLYQAMSKCGDLLRAFGGHPNAAGVTIEEDQIPRFRERLGQLVAEWTGDTRVPPLLHVDSEVRLEQVNLKLIQELDALHPFGMGNPEPTLAITNLKVVDARVVGSKHLKLRVRQEQSAPFESIGFGMAPTQGQQIDFRGPVDLAVRPELNHWNGYDRIQLRIRAIRGSLEA